ncbi:MAG: hypothetical protein K8W52_38790 [Deltaproteobacteria bacterium]|nr:hypothetical protein [Deltaproteobacteria bacterium]
MSTRAVITTIPAATETLGRMLGTAPTSLTPDAIAAVTGDLDWIPCDDWEERADLELARATGLLEVPFAGVLLIITDTALIARQGGVLVPASRLAEFVGEYPARYGECFFGGDVIVAETQGERVWLFHHEGAHALFSGRAAT